MSILNSWCRCALAATVAAVTMFPHSARAQFHNPEPLSFKWSTGQSVQPTFIGWSHSPDGGYEMWYGYLNRNYVETPTIPVGPNNKIEPGEMDRDQPTFFEPRGHEELFSVHVPADWSPTRELIWTVTVNGTTEQAVAWLKPEWEIDPIHHGRQGLSEEILANKAPTLDVSGAVKTAKVGMPVTIVVAVQDDGLPKPREEQAGAPRAVGQETPPTLVRPEGEPEAPHNVPVIPEGRGGRGPAPKGLYVQWMEWRGPAAIKFEPGTRVEVKDGKAEITAVFPQPGTYLLRAWANDTDRKTPQDLTITVTGM